MELYLVIFKCWIDNKSYMEYIYANDLFDCWSKAYDISMQPGLIEGDFNIYMQVY